MTFQPLEHYGNNFINEDATRFISDFLNQGEKIEMAKTAKDTNQVLKERLPDKTHYVTTVRPNCFSTCVEKNGVYKIHRDITTGDTVDDDMLTHIGSNEDEDYLHFWVSGFHDGKERSKYRPRGHVCLFEITQNQSELVVERLLENKDLSVFDPNRRTIPDNVIDAFIKNTSITKFSSDQFQTQMSVMFNVMLKRKTLLEEIKIRGLIDGDIIYIIRDLCLTNLKRMDLSVDACGYSEIRHDGEHMSLLCEKLEECTKLESLSFVNADIWGLDGVVENNKELKFLHIEHSSVNLYDPIDASCCKFLEDMTPESVFMMNCTSDNMDMIQMALFANKNIVKMDLEDTPISSASVKELCKMIEMGNLTQLCLTGCGIDVDGLHCIFTSTMVSTSRLTHIRILNTDDVEDYHKFGKITSSSLRHIHIELEDIMELDIFMGLDKFHKKMIDIGTPCTIDTRRYDDWYDNDRSGVGEIFEARIKQIAASK